jgi:hypothetical protein
VSSNTFATKEDGEPDHAGDPGASSVWWKWTAPADGYTTFDTHGSSFDTLLAVYIGSSVSNLTLVDENDDDSELATSSVQFTAASGVTYWIAVDGYSFETGDITVNQSFTPAPTTLKPTVNAAPSYLILTAQDGSFHLRVDGPAGAEVEVQVSDDLIHWTTAATNTLAGKPWIFSDPFLPDRDHHFYRVVRHLE